MPKMFSLSTIFLNFFFAHENMKKLASKVAKPAQIQPKSQFLFHKNLPPRNFSIMTLLTITHNIFSLSKIKKAKRNGKLNAKNSILTVEILIPRSRNGPLYLRYMSYGILKKMGSKFGMEQKVQSFDKPGGIMTKCSYLE